MVDAIEEAAFWIVGLSLYAAAFIAVFIFAPMKRRYKQKQRDSMASEIFEGLKAGHASPHPFALYLRPFASTNRVVEAGNLGQRVAISQLGLLGLVLKVGHNELEQRLARGVGPVAPMIALGRPGEHFGAGRIPTSDENWRADIALLIRHARMIFFLPSESAGTSWEFTHLVETGAMTKTFVIDPPNKFRKKKEYDQAQEWEAVRQSFASQGYRLPPDDKKGLLLYFAEPGDPTLSETLNVQKMDVLQAQLADVNTRLAS